MTARDAARLRQLAAETLALADQMTDTSCRRGMVSIAASYERLAEYADAAGTRRDAARRPPREAK